MASLKAVLFNDEKTRKGSLGGSVKRVLIGTTIGVAQGTVEAKDRVIMGWKLSTITPIAITLAGVAATMVGKHDMIRSVGADATVAGSVLLGQKFVAPEITKLIGGVSSGRLLSRSFKRGGQTGGSPSGNPYGFVNTQLYG